MQANRPIWFRQGLNAACRRYLSFAPEYRHLEKQIAWETVGWTTDPRNDGVGRNQNLSFDTIAVRAYIRHRYTDYGHSMNRHRVLYGMIPQHPKMKVTAERKVDEFLAKHRIQVCF